MEYKNILQNWISFQTLRYRKKLKMQNAYPCTVIYRGDTMNNYELSFINHERIEARCDIGHFTVPIENFRGFTSEGRRITLVLGPDGRAPLILEFSSPEIHAAVLAEVQDFAGDRINLLPSPPSSEASASSSSSSPSSPEEDG